MPLEFLFATVSPIIDRVTTTHVTSGTRLGPYEIVAPIGAGGMGEVWKARDTRLDRSVAIKILPAEFATNATLRMRFEREAKTISQLNHPNICSLFDVGDNYLVMELLEGESLADRLSRGPLPMSETLRVGAQIADALDRAHRAGIVHRDLKPGNIMLTKSGAKLLDFGLAKSQASGLGPRASVIETEHKPLTEEGTILGTFQYMAPEQLEDSNVDHRADIFSLGAVLYEMASGRRAFQGKTKTSVAAAVLSGEPAPLSQVQPLSPASFEHIVQRCLAKNPDERWQSARDVAEELKWIATKASDAGPATRHHKTREAIAWTVAVLAIVAAATFAYVLRRPHKRFVTSVNAPEKTRFAFETSQAVISPDGRALAFVAIEVDGRTALWVRRLDSPTAQKLTGTENASFPFWSPDSKSIAFFNGEKLSKIDAAGGPVEPIADASVGRGGSWGSRGVILFAPSASDAIYAVSSSGGDVRRVTNLEEGPSHRFPAFLPDGIHFFFFKQGLPQDQPNIFLGSIEGGAPKPVMHADAAVTWSEGGVLYVRDGTLRVRHFDLRTLEFDGEPVMVAEDVQRNGALGYQNVSASNQGMLTYVAGESANSSRLVWVDRSGKQLDALPEPGEYYDPRLSPDGKTLVYAARAGALNLFLYDVGRRVSTRFTFGKADELNPVWSPDGQAVAFTSFVGSVGDVHVKGVSGTEPERTLVRDGRRRVVSEWSRDAIFMNAMNAKTNWDIEIYSMRDNKVRPFIRTPYGEWGATVSPNGRWVAYTSTESGSPEIYVRRFEIGAESAKWQVSPAGGRGAAWSPDGKEIYYAAPDGKLMAAKVLEDSGTLHVEMAAPLMPLRLRYGGLSRAQFSTRDGKTFVINRAMEDEAAGVSVTVVQNWRSPR